MGWAGLGGLGCLFRVLLLLLLLRRRSIAPALSTLLLLSPCNSSEPPAIPPAPLQTTTDRLSESRAALERKAALYERLARGEVEDEGGCGRESVGGWEPVV